MSLAQAISSVKRVLAREPGMVTVGWNERSARTLAGWPILTFTPTGDFRT